MRLVQNPWPFSTDLSHAFNATVRRTVPRWERFSRLLIERPRRPAPLANRYFMGGAGQSGERSSRLSMTIRVHPLPADTALARAIARNTGPVPEDVSSIITWGADGHVLTAQAVGWWLWSRSKPPAQRRASDHVLLTTLAAVLLPHLLKTQLDQVRPHRRTVRGHLHGIPLSGKGSMRFPQAMPCMSEPLLPPRTNCRRPGETWSGPLVPLSRRRIVLLAHWASDVIAGLAIGAALERLMRRLTGFKGWVSHGAITLAAWSACRPSLHRYARIVRARCSMGSALA